MPPPATSFLPGGASPVASAGSVPPPASTFAPAVAPSASSDMPPAADSFLPKGQPASDSPAYFQSMSPDGTFLGISDQHDISGKPYFAYKPPGEATTTDTTRVATTFDPRVAQVLSPSVLQNGRMPYSVSAPIKKALGGNYSTELDHSIALELAGSNNQSNLHVEPGRTNGGEAARFDTEENALAKLVQQGKMSLWDAQYKLASDKHAAGDNNNIPFVDKQTAAKGMTFDVGGGAPSEAWLRGRSMALETEAQALKSMKVDTTDSAAVAAYNARLDAYKARAADFNSKLDAYNTAQKQLNAFSSAANSGFDSNATTIKYPFMDSGQTLPNYNGVGSAINNTIKWGVELPEEAVRTALQAVGKDLPQTGAYSDGTQNSPKDYFNSMYSSLVNQGVSSTKASWISGLYAASQTTLDLLPGASLIDDGLKSLVEHVAVNNEELVAAHIALGSPATLQEAHQNLNMARMVVSPDIVQGAGGSAEDIARATEATKKLNGAYEILQNQGIPRSGLIQKAAGFAQKLVSPISDLMKGANTTAKVGTEAVKPNLALDNKSAVGAETIKPQAETKIAALTDTIGTRSVSEVNQDLQQAKDHLSFLQDAMADHPGRGVGKFINWRTGEFIKGGDAKAMDAMGQEASNGGDLETVLEHGKNYKAMEAQAIALKNEIKRYKAELKTAIPDTVVPASASTELPPFPVPEDKSVVLHASFPGAGTLSKFVEKDVIPKGAETVSFMKNVVKDTSKLFSPSLVKKQGEAITGAALMRAEQIKSAAWKAADARRSWWLSVPEETRADFIDRMETGNTDFPKEKATMIQLANQYRERLNRAFEHETSIGVKEHYIDNYFPHLWDDPEKAKVVFSQIRASMGKGSFTKLRTIDLIKEGRALGLKLKTTNPEELVLLREMDGVRIGAKTEIEKELLANGIALPANADGVGAGWKTFAGTDGKILAVPPDIFKMLDNALFKPSLWSEPGYLGKIFRSVMAIKGVFIPLKLAVSAFHPIHIAFIRMADGLATAEKSLVLGVSSPAHALSDATRAATMVYQAKDIKDFYSIVKAWDKPSSEWTDRERTIINYIIEGGGTPKQSEENLVRSRDAFRAAVKDENYIGAAIRGFPKMIEMSQKWMFESYIPSLKIASYTKTVEQLMRAHPEFATDTVARKVALREAWKSIDNRFGQMNYKTLFWKPIMKAAGQASFLSLGWQLGFLREFGGGGIDLGKLMVKGITGKATAEDVTDKLLFSMNYILVAAITGGLMTYAMTGQRPKEMADFFYPRTGDTNPDGTPARVNTSFYTREFFTLAHNWRMNGLIGGTLATAQSKMNPIMSATADLWNNSDFQHYQIRDTNAPAMTQAEQALKFWFSQTAIPISAGNAAKAQSMHEQLLNYGGFNAAPTYINHTHMQDEIFATVDRVLGQGTKPFASKLAAQAKANIRTLYLKGNIAGANAALDNAVSKGYIASRGRAAFIKSLDIPSDVRAFQLLAQYPTEQEHLLSQMSEKDLARYAEYASSKVKGHISQLSPTAYQFVQDLKSGKIQLDHFHKEQVVNQ